MKKSMYLLFAVLTVTALAISACAPAATPAPTEAHRHDRRTRHDGMPAMTEEPVMPPKNPPCLPWALLTTQSL